MTVLLQCLLATLCFQQKILTCCFVWQGETSVGKTSLITYLSKATGNTCLRINNHEHTDIQEYVGAYCMDHQGNFTFQVKLSREQIYS